MLAPNTELAATLRDAVERHHQACGRDIWPTPRVRDFASWLREQYLRRPSSAAPALRALQDFEERELWRCIVQEDTRGGALLEPAAAAAAARRARQAIYAYAIPADAIAASASDEASALLHWIDGFDRRCRALGCISGDELLQTFAASPEPVAWLDSPAWRPAAARWLTQHAQRKIDPAAAGGSAATLGDTTPLLCHAANPTEEIAAAAAWARENLQASADFRAWICMPDLNLRRPEVIDAFDAALAAPRFGLTDAHGIAPYAVAGGTPLADHPSVRAALEILSVVQGSIPFERFSALLRSDELQAVAGDASTAALLDVELRRRAPSELPLRAWLALAERVAAERSLAAVTAVRRLAAALDWLEPLRGQYPLSRWAPLWIGAWEQGPWAARGGWSSTEYQAAERLRELVAALAAADQLFGPQSQAAALRLLLSAARETAFQPQTGIPALWISGQNADPWLNYDALWIAGRSAESWPPPPDLVPLLPVPVQRAYGIIGATAESQLRAALDLQARWLQRAPRCVFSWADPGEGRSAAPSALLSPQCRPIGGAAPEVRPHWSSALRRAPKLEQLIDARAPPFAAGERTRGVATLRSQSRCAFRGFAETRLRADPLSRPTPGFSDRERGRLLHAALEHIWSSLGDAAALAALLPAAQSQLIGVSVAQALERICAERDPGERWRERERERMARVLAQWLEVERRRPPFSIERLDEGREIARHAGLEFSCRIDRLDRLADGARVLIDYKSGLAHADWRGDRPDNPQLPLYALLHPDTLVAIAYAQINAAACRFVPEAERAGIFEPGRRGTHIEGAANFAELMQWWRGRIESLAGDFRDGRAAVDPTAQACRSCHLQGLCRVGAGLGDSDDAGRPADGDG